ncbi:wd repeat domain 22 [Moniliophthora roreri]|nr:wd repeat domain 22 [Moniliophthora roreri]
MSSSPHQGNSRTRKIAENSSDSKSASSLSTSDCSSRKRRRIAASAIRKATLPGTNPLFNTLPHTGGSSSMFDRGFPYSCKLSAHGSCVNALAFSRLDARYMASGGDDLQIHLWDFHQENLEEPCHTFIGPRSNIFCFDFSCKNRSLFA